MGSRLNPHRPKNETPGPGAPWAKRLPLPVQIVIVALSLSLVLGVIASFSPGLFVTTEKPVAPHGVESPGRELAVTLRFAGEQRVSVDGIVVGDFSEEARVNVRPGRHRFELTGDDGRRARVVTVMPGENTEIVFEGD